MSRAGLGPGHRRSRQTARSRERHGQPRTQPPAPRLRPRPSGLGGWDTVTCCHVSPSVCGTVRAAADAAARPATGSRAISRPFSFALLAPRTGGPRSGREVRPSRRGLKPDPARGSALSCVFLCSGRWPRLAAEVGAVVLPVWARSSCDRLVSVKISPIVSFWAG